MNKHGVTDTDNDIFEASNLPIGTKENIATNINKARSYEDAFESKEGRLLTKDLDDILNEELSRILNYRHNPELSIEQNYNNLITYITSYRTAKGVKDRWLSVIKAGENGCKKIKEVSEIIQGKIKVRR